jgi:ABC-2 type transport system permease protein
VKFDRRKVWAIAAANASGAARDPRLIFFAIFFPIIIIVLVGSIFGAAGRRVPLAVVQHDNGPLATQLVHDLKATPSVKVKPFTTLRAVRREVRRGRISAGLIIPAEYDSVLSSGGQPLLTIVTQRGRVETGVLRAAIGDVTGHQAATAAAAKSGIQLTGRAAPTVAESTLGSHGRSKVPSPFSYTSASNLILFTFVNTLAIGGFLVRTRKLGVTRRMLSTPTSPLTIVMGEALGRLIPAFVQAVGLIAIGTFIFGVDWGDPLGVAGVVVLFVVMSTAAGLLFGTVLKSEDQAIAIAAPVGIALAMLGGCMWSLEGVNSAMRIAGHITPHAWAMDALVALIYGGVSASEVVRPILVLFGFAVVLTTLATYRLRKVTLEAAR